MQRRRKLLKHHLSQSLLKGDVAAQKGKEDKVTSLPEDLEVQGNLSLKGCNNLKALPNGLVVKGDLRMKFCKMLEMIPAGIVVGGSLRLIECEKLTELSLAEAHINGEVFLPGCSNLKKVILPENINGRLVLSDCVNLKSLPQENLVVEGSIEMVNCQNLIELPQNLTAQDDLNLFGCKELGLQNVKKLQVDGDLNLASCNKLKELPDGLVLSRETDVILRDSGIEKLPLGLQLVGNLNLRNCTKLSSIPSKIKVLGNLNLHGCTRLTELPQVRVDKVLNMTGCSNLEMISDDIICSGDITLTGCTSLQKLPNSFHSVNGNLNISDCYQIEELPSGLSVKRHLNIERCSGITSLPESIFDWALTEDGERHNIYIAGSGLSLETLVWIRDQHFESLRFHNYLWSNGEEAFSETFASLDEAIRFWEKEAKEDEDVGGNRGRDLVQQKDRVIGKFQKPEESSLLLFLSKLQGAKEFGIKEQRKPLAKRVIELLETLFEHQDESIKNGILIRISDSLDACNDKPIWALNQMHLMVEISRARGDREKLEKLGRRALRLNIVHEHAKRKCESLSFVDDVCVYLRYEIDLKDELDLPVSALSMHFPNYMRVEPKDINSARKAANGVTNEEYKSFLENWPEWQRQLRLEAVEEIDANLESLSKRKSVSLRKSLRTMLGNSVKDPVVLDKTQYSWNDLKRHWIDTGMDFNNRPWPIDDFQAHLKRL